jgi:hypothetical protein
VIVVCIRMSVVLRLEGEYLRIMGECCVHGLIFGEGVEYLTVANNK